jgi:hypothetical protein
VLGSGKYPRPQGQAQSSERGEAGSEHQEVPAVARWEVVAYRPTSRTHSWLELFLGRSHNMNYDHVHPVDSNDQQSPTGCAGTSRLAPRGVAQP